MSDMVEKAVPAAVLLLLAEPDHEERLLLTIATSTPLYLNDGGWDLTTGGHTYVPRAFRVSGWQYGPISRAGVTVSIDNRDDVISDWAYSEKLTDRVLSVMRLIRRSAEEPWLTGWAPITAPITASGGNGAEWVVSAGGGSGMRQRAGLTVGDLNCTYRFKGARCAYAGAATSCLHTWDACVTLGNTARFGGFRWAVEPGQPVQVGDAIITVPGDRGGGIPTPSWSPRQRPLGGGGGGFEL